MGNSADTSNRAEDDSQLGFPEPRVDLLKGASISIESSRKVKGNEHRMGFRVCFPCLASHFAETPQHRETNELPI